VPAHRSISVSRTPRAFLRALGLAALLTTLSVTLATAQERNAAIRVHVTVLDVADSDVLGAHAMAEASVNAAVGATPAGLAWRITSGRSPELSLRAENIAAGSLRGAPRVAICEVAHAAASACQGQLLPALRVSGGYGTPGLIVQLRSGPTPAMEAPVRLTLASIAL
jgi:hypothetical protein